MVMPATSVKFVNSPDEKNFLDEDDKARPGYNLTLPHFESDSENSLIQVECKVQEINKVRYKSTSLSPNEVSI